MKSLTFNGIRKDWLYLLQGREKPPFAPIDRRMISVPGMAGAYLSSTNVRPLPINQPIGIVAKSDVEALQIKEELAEWLFTDEPVELQFDDEPGRTYYAIVQNTIEDFSRFAEFRTGTIQFLCLDPYSYGSEQTIEPNDDTFIIENKGTAEADPVFELEVLEPTTFAMVSNGDEYMMIGRPYDVDETPVEKYPEVRRWRMDSLVGWSHMTQGYILDDEVTGGTVSGSNIVVDNNRFTPSSYGSAITGWYGPALRASLPESIQDFSITLGVRANNDGKGTGKVMAIFLDEDDKIVCSIGLINSRLGTKNMRVLARLNDGENIRRRRVFDYPGDAGANSTVFSNRPLNIRLRREGNTFEAYTWQVRDGIQHARHRETIIDDNPDFQRPIRQVVLFFAKYGNNPVFPMYISGLRINKSNALTEDEVPIIAEEGDQIIFDHATGDCYVNGEPVPFDFGADFFKLHKGFNSIAVLPENTFNAKVQFRERYR